MLPVPIPHEQVNDETVLLVDWLIPDGSQVQAGQPIATIETSKTTAEVAAPQAGYLRYKIPKGTEVAVGRVFCYIGAGPAEPFPEENTSSPGTPQTASPPGFAATAVRQAPADNLPAFNSSATSVPLSAGMRFSRRSLALIERHGLDLEQFKDRGLIRESDVLALLNRKGAAETPTAVSSLSAGSAGPIPAPIAAAGVPLRIEELPRAKRLEARYLASGHRHTLTSVVSVICSTSGLKAAVSLCPELGSGASSLILYETARLLRKYPMFNAFHDDGRIHYYEQVNIGLAVDAGHGLKVPVIAGADKKGIGEIAHEVEDLVFSYLNNELAVESLSGGTFTITDLSGEEVFLFHPLINQGQAAILGVGAEYYPPGSEEGVFNLILSFDHQLTEGRMAARFLKDLRDRIGSYEAALRSNQASARKELACSRCLRTGSELADINVPMLQEVRADGEKSLICGICLEGW